MEKRINDKIREIEKGIPNLDANDGILDFELDDWNDFDEIKAYIEKKYNGITLSKLKIGKRKCVDINWLEKLCQK